MLTTLLSYPKLRMVCKKMLAKLNDWCAKWRIMVHESKIKVLHFRPKSKCATDVTFKCGVKNVEVGTSYKYLGFWFNGHLDMRFSIREIAKSASRALGAIYSKILCAGCLRFPVYIKLIETIVEPVLFFCSGIWGHTKYKEIESVLNKACRYFLGVTKHCSNVSWRVTWVGILAKLSKKIKQYVYGVDCEIPQNIESYDVSTNGLYVKVELGNGKCSDSLTVII